MTIFIGALVFLICYGFGVGTPEHFLLGDKAQRFLPYGVLIYALNSVTVIPVLEEVLNREKKDMPYIIIIGGIICMSLVLLR
ncbi:hypothetical protein KBC03_02210 [Patescibacteria group bacterium]|nr:hypothetical protein [Patescibacteria group bacterium]